MDLEDEEQTARRRWWIHLAMCVAFALMGLLLPPMGTIHDSVLWVFAQCLIYAGSVLGVTGFLKSSRGVNK